MVGGLIEAGQFRHAADPDASGHLEPLVVAVDGTHATVHLPPLATWQMIVVRSR